MNIDFFQEKFEEAWNQTLSIRRNILAFFVLVACGVLFLFFRTLAAEAGPWVGLSLTFVPFFLSIGILLSAGILLVRLAEEERQGRTFDPFKIVFETPEVFFVAAYFSIPFLFVYLLLWFMQGIFLLLTEIPALGNLIGTIFAFAPFLLHLSTLFLCVGSFVFLFALPPVIAAHGVHRLVVSEMLMIQFRQSPFRFFFLALVGAFPFVLTLGLLLLAGYWTTHFIDLASSPFLQAIQSLFLMIPSAVFLAPTLVFFFQFASEIHRVYYPKTI